MGTRLSTDQPRSSACESGGWEGARNSASKIYLNRGVRAARTCSLTIRVQNYRILNGWTFMTALPICSCFHTGSRAWIFPDFGCFSSTILSYIQGLLIFAVFSHVWPVNSYLNPQLWLCWATSRTYLVVPSPFRSRLNK